MAKKNKTQDADVQALRELLQGISPDVIAQALRPAQETIWPQSQPSVADMVKAENARSERIDAFETSKLGVANIVRKRAAKPKSNGRKRKPAYTKADRIANLAKAREAKAQYAREHEAVQEREAAKRAQNVAPRPNGRKIAGLTILHRANGTPYVVVQAFDGAKHEVQNPQGPANKRQRFALYAYSGDKTWVEKNAAGEYTHHTGVTKLAAWTHVNAYKREGTEFFGWRKAQGKRAKAEMTDAVNRAAKRKPAKQPTLADVMAMLKQVVTGGNKLVG